MCSFLPSADCSVEVQSGHLLCRVLAQVKSSPRWVSIQGLVSVMPNNNDCVFSEQIACSSVVASTAVSLLNCGSTHCPHSKVNCDCGRYDDTSRALLYFMQVCISNCFQHQDMNTQYDRIQQCMVPDNKTLGQVTLKVLRSFGWRRALAIVNGSSSRELYEV